MHLHVATHVNWRLRPSIQKLLCALEKIGRTVEAARSRCVREPQTTTTRRNTQTNGQDCKNR